MINAKLMMSDKFWILEEEGKKIGTLQAMDKGYILIMNGDKSFIQDVDLYKKYKIKLEKKAIVNQAVPTENIIFEYPCAGIHYNSVWNCKENLPLYTKKAASKSLHCAGYYIVKFDKGWAEAFCPKLVTLHKYPFKGPFKTQIEARSILVKER
jgi:hypothetical protein